MMIRFVLFASVLMLASTANAQRVFRASSIDIEQNERIDAIDARVGRIEADIALVASAIEKQAEAKSAIVQAVAMPSVVAKPSPAKAQTTVAVSRPSPQPVASNYYSQAELISIVRAAYPSGNYTQYADVKPRSAVWNHLQDSNHRFTAAQVSGLPQDIALGLHGLHHANRIRATRSTTQASVPSPQPRPVAQAQPTYQAAGGCANGRCPTPARSQPQQQRFRIFSRLGS